MVLILAGAIGLSGPAEAGQRTYVVVATGEVGGVYFPLGTALAEIWSATVPGVQAMAQVTAGSVANVRLVARGDADVAFAQHDVVWYAARGVEPFAELGRPLAGNLRGVAMLYPEVVQVVTLKGRGINGITDLKGRRVAVGAPGSGTAVNARQILRHFGLDAARMHQEFLTFAEAADQLRDGLIDAAFFTAGISTAAVQEATAGGDLQLLPIPRAAADALRVQYPLYSAAEIPARAYRGQDRPVDTVAVVAMLLTRQEADEQLVYSLTRALWEHADRLRRAHARGQDISLVAARRGMPIPAHPGAHRYYRERGIR
ncbi:MAG: TAXI family TRAP transporter solute-binding subunit [Armatimonadota bacterium]|nr:TAXI family TRAP transporter solute-binding subunit [Armatimonadota bacterium]